MAGYGMIRVATWNVWGRFGPWEERWPAIVDELRALDPDDYGIFADLELTDPY